MKLKNKKTGEIVDLVKGYIKDSYYGQKIEIKPVAISNKEGYVYSSLAELNEEWEDYEEPKEWYTINKFDGSIQKINDDTCAWTDEEKESIAELGFRFDTREEAEEAVEKLKAWKRLKDKGFRFDGFYDKSKQHILWHCGLPYITDDEFYKDLDLLFGGEE